MFVCTLFLSVLLSIPYIYVTCYLRRCIKFSIEKVRVSYLFQYLVIDLTGTLPLEAVIFYLFYSFRTHHQLFEPFGRQGMLIRASSFDSVINMQIKD